MKIMIPFAHAGHEHVTNPQAVDHSHPVNMGLIIGITLAVFVSLAVIVRLLSQSAKKEEKYD